MTGSSRPANHKGIPMGKNIASTFLMLLGVTTLACACNTHAPAPSLTWLPASDDPAGVSTTLDATTARDDAIAPGGAAAVASYTPELIAVNSSSAVASEGTNNQVSAAQPLVPVRPVPVAPAAQNKGHYETVYAGFRGRRSYQVWVSNQPQTSQPVRYYSVGRGGCANCR